MRYVRIYQQADAATRAAYFAAPGAPRISRPTLTFAVGGDTGDADLGIGEFRALVAVFNTPTREDFFGDTFTFMPGAFADVLAAADAEHPIPVVWTHQWNSIPLGPVVQAQETKDGLLVHGRMDVGSDSPRGELSRGVRDAMRDRTIREFSFGALFDEESLEVEDRLDEDGKPVEGIFGAAKNIKVHRIAELFEVGPTLVGRHPDTRLIEVQGGELPRLQPQAQGPRADEVREQLERAGRLASLGIVIK